MIKKDTEEIFERDGLCKRNERLTVIKNIEAAIESGDFNREVEQIFHNVTEKERKRVIISFDNKRRSIPARIKKFTARRLAEKFTRKVNRYTSIVGIENALSVRGGAIITANHYAPTDSTPVRMLACACNKRKKLHIIIQEKNVFMTGAFGFLMKNCNTHPVSSSAEYMIKNLEPEIASLTKGENYILIYPEENMWRGYKAPRPTRDGAYHYAAKYGVPIIPTFTEMRTVEGERDAEGFLPIIHTLHVLPPIYPDKNLSVRENRKIMQERDFNEKKKLYEELYGIKYEEISSFVAERDIAGLVPDDK